MLGIIRNRFEWNTWTRALSHIPRYTIEVLSLGFFTIHRGKITQYGSPWSSSLVHLGTNLVIILSLGYLHTNWIIKYWDARC